MNEEKIIYLTVQIRQAEGLRNASKKPKEREAFTHRIRILKAELSPLLDAYVKERQKSPKKEDKSNEDLGPKGITESLHAWADRKLGEVSFVNSLAEGPVSVAGTFDTVSYIIHFQRTQTL